MKRLYLSAFLGICVVSIFSNDVFATAEDLIAFKKRHAAYVAENDIAAIGDFGKIIKLKKGEAPVEIAKIVTFMEADTVPRAWLEWFKRTYREQKQISYKKFAAAVFYPYEILETTHKQHFQQMNYAFKVSFMYSSEFDASGLARRIKNIGTSSFAISSAEELYHLLDIGLIASSSSFLDDVKDYAKRAPGVLEHLKAIPNLNAIQSLNLGFLFKNIGNDEAALECFSHSARKGSFRANIEYGNIVLKKNFLHGVDFFRGLGAYGIWKIAQCYRYGIATERNIRTANSYYLEALSHNDHNFPEIQFDAGEFAVHYASSQPKQDIFQSVMTLAIQHYLRAGDFCLGLGYLKAAQSSLDVVKLHPDTTGPLFSDDFRRDMTRKAFMKGHVSKIIKFDDDAETIVVREHAEQVDRYFGD